MDIVCPGLKTKICVEFLNGCFMPLWPQNQVMVSNGLFRLKTSLRIARGSSEIKIELSLSSFKLTESCMPSKIQYNFLFCLLTTHTHTHFYADCKLHEDRKFYYFVHFYSLTFFYTLVRSRCLVNTS